MQLNKLQKLGLTGLSLMIVITILLHVFAGVSLRAILPLYMPWAVLLLIGFTNKKRK